MLKQIQMYIRSAASISSKKNSLNILLVKSKLESKFCYINNIKTDNFTISTLFHIESAGNYIQSMVFVRANRE